MSSIVSPRMICTNSVFILHCCFTAATKKFLIKKYSKLKSRRKPRSASENGNWLVFESLVRDGGAFVLRMCRHPVRLCFVIRFIVNVARSFVGSRDRFACARATWFMTLAIYYLTVFLSFKLRFKGNFEPLALFYRAMFFMIALVPTTTLPVSRNLGITRPNP